MLPTKQQKATLKESKNKIFHPLAHFLRKHRIKSGHITFLSFLSGVFAAIFLFDTNILFALFLILMIFFDMLDGTVAHLEKKKGKPFKRGILADDLSDRTTSLLILLKLYLSLNDARILYICLFYALVKTSHILLRQLKSEGFHILQFDRIPFFLFIFELYWPGILLVFFSTIVNAFELVLKKK